tara:strand:- start:3228 stop:3434 length:207 start_codon:yes stop_codon:yes gene_type:complete
MSEPKIENFLVYTRKQVQLINENKRSIKVPTFSTLLHTLGRYNATPKHYTLKRKNLETTIHQLLKDEK